MAEIIELAGRTKPMTREDYRRYVVRSLIRILRHAREAGDKTMTRWTMIALLEVDWREGDLAPGEMDFLFENRP
jgi:hypothetical protein